MEVEFVFRIK